MVTGIILATSEVIVAAGEGARATAEIRTWVDFIAILGLLIGAFKWWSSGWKVGVPIVVSVAIIYALIASIQGVGAIGRAILGFFGVSV